jgi:formamidopyrimidine-DNA glycosylase
VPEGDTVYQAAKKLHRALGGRELVATTFRVPRYATLDLSGRELREVTSRGKHLLFRLEGGLSLHTHFEMDGVWHLYPKGRRWRAPAFQARVILETAEHQAVGFRLPVVEVFETRREAGRLAHLGPDILGADWDAREGARRLRSCGRKPIGDALLDQRVIAGWGNVYRCEICFLAGVSPWTPVEEVGDLERVAALGRRLIYANRSSAGHVTTGDTRPGRRHWVYGRKDLPCLRCGTPVRKSGGPVERVTYWCPHCQHSPATVTAAGAAGQHLGPGREVYSREDAPL